MTGLPLLEGNARRDYPQPSISRRPGATPQQHYFIVALADEVFFAYISPGRALSVLADEMNHRGQSLHILQRKES
jgi:hypothetical protein